MSTCTLPRGAEAPSVARRHLRLVGAGWDEDLVFDSGRTCTDQLVRGGGGPADSTPVGSYLEGLHLSGRGLRIVDVLAKRWGVIEQPTGKVVWFELAAPDRRLTHRYGYGAGTVGAQGRTGLRGDPHRRQSSGTSRESGR